MNRLSFQRGPLFALTLAMTWGGCSKQVDKSSSDQWPIARAELAQEAERPGKGTYQRYCVSCHGMDGRGNGGVTGADFVGDARALSEKSDEELSTSVRDGRVGERATMPAHRPILSDEQIAQVVAYVRGRFLQTASSDDTTSP